MPEGIKGNNIQTKKNHKFALHAILWFFLQNARRKIELEGRPVEELVEGGDEKLSDGLEEVEAVVGWVWVGREAH